MEGKLVGVFGSDPGAKAGLLGSVAKKSEAEGSLGVYRRVEAGTSYSFLDDSLFPEKVQGYTRIASIADHALFVLPRYGKMAAPDGELVVVVDSFGLDGSIVAIDEEPPPGLSALLKGTRLESFAAASRSSKSSVIDLAPARPGPNAPAKGTMVFVDRAFSVKGVGVVVLGFVLGGKVSVHDDLRLVPNPEGKTAEVRGIQVSDEDQETVGRGVRVGLSLKGVELKDLDKVSWMDDGSFALTDRVSFAFSKSRFYKQGVDGRDLHLQMPGELLTCKVKGEADVEAALTAPVPVWDGMRVGLVDLNGKGLRVAGGGVCRAPP